ncbi:hypothetical protein MUG60_00700 [Kaistella montana]|nr:hypothetical protein [Kaistella montana]
MKRASLIVLITLAGLLVIALPTALFFGLGDLVLGGDASSALLTVGFMAAGLALLWAVQFAWSSWRESRARRRRD